MKYKQLEKLLGRTREAIEGKAFRLGFKRELEYYFKDIYLKPTEKAYIAAFIDGEGTISINNNKRNIVASICLFNTKPFVLEVILGWTNRKGKIFHLEKKRNHNRIRPLYTLRTRDKGAIYPLLKLIEPYLILKHVQATIVMDWIKNKIDDEDAIKRIRKLNKKGGSYSLALDE